MPEMNGLDALLAIRAEFPDAKVVVLTTYEDGGFTSHGHRRIVPSRDELRRPDSTFAGRLNILRTGRYERTRDEPRAKGSPPPRPATRA